MQKFKSLSNNNSKLTCLLWCFFSKTYWGGWLQGLTKRIRLCTFSFLLLDANIAPSVPKCNLANTGTFRIVKAESARLLPHSLQLAAVLTPLKLDEWHRHLQTFPDRQFTDYILAGLSEGLHVGFVWTTRMYPTKNNNN